MRKEFSESVSRLIEDFRTKQADWLNMGTPWVTEGAKAWLSANILPTDSVLEFGTGRSTIFWATQAGKVTVVEGSPDWTVWVLLYLYDHPYLLKKVRFYFCPTEWNPSFPGGIRRYWTENRHALNIENVHDLERDLISVSFPGHNVVLFDGNIRDSVFYYQSQNLNFDELDVIVVDNCENILTSESAGLLIPKTYIRLDFVAGNKDQIPSHQNGKHITSIWVKEERLSNSKTIYTQVNPRMSSEERAAHMLPAQNFDLAKRLEGTHSYLRDVLRLPVRRENR